MRRAAFLVPPLLLALGAAPANDALRIIPIDVEGGAATLYVTPQGHSLLIDTGWPAGMGGPRGGAAGAAPSPSSAERIVAQIKAAGLTRLDYLMLSHYHTDHAGGATELTKLIEVGTFVDHGPNREFPANASAPPPPTSTVALYAAYLAAIGDKPHRVMAPGEVLKIDDLTLTAVTSDGTPIDRPLAGAGEPGANCDKAVSEPSNGGEENPRSLGILFTYGSARILSLGDSTWSTENKLVCPIDKVGRVDLMVVDNHGSANASSLPLLSTVRPAVAVIENGPAKGAEAATFGVLRQYPGLANLWQLHFATRNGADANAPADQIANPDGAADAINPLKIEAAKSGAITVTNPRNGFSRTYAKRP